MLSILKEQRTDDWFIDWMRKVYLLLFAFTPAVLIISLLLPNYVMVPIVAWCGGWKADFAELSLTKDTHSSFIALGPEIIAVQNQAEYYLFQTGWDVEILKRRE